MTRLLNAEIDMLAVAAEAESGTQLPLALSLEGVANKLLARGLLQEAEGRVRITPEGRAALVENADRVFDWAETDRTA